MGLVHAFNKGDVKGSEVSKKVKDVAKGMKKSDVKKYASTKHKGKPEKVKKEAIDKIREMIRMELESCGYVMSAKNPSHKLKSPGGTGEEDSKLKESKLNEGEKENIYKLLVKYGNTPEDAKQMVSKTYDYIKKAYRNANASKKAEIMSSLMKFETTEQFSNLVEKCWKGYMIHPKRKTKKLFGKTYPNCIKKEAVDKQQGTTILNQLGGKRFIMFTGAKHFGVGKEGLSFKIGRNSKQVNHIKIDYDRGRDLYNMKFDWVTKKGIKTKKEVKGVYADMLQDVFSRHTGMATRF